MKWQDLKVSKDSTHFLFKDKPIFDKYFIEVLKFHTPGLAPVIDYTGAYHINKEGLPLYPQRYNRTFGFYCNRAAIVNNNKWFHICDLGKKAYSDFYSWAGNYQENLCTVRDNSNYYFHIDLNGKRLYPNNYSYVGDYKDGIACVKISTEGYKHIDNKGNFINNKTFLELGVFHKNFATAKDKNGWHHINQNGEEVYSDRYFSIEPFYNGFALVTNFANNQLIIDEQGNQILFI